jgi:hypothetical protein
MSHDLEPVDEGVRLALARLGLVDVEVMLRLRAEWDELAGAPWAGASRPLGLHAGELVVEALQPGLVATLRYATVGLAGRLADELSTRRIDRVSVVPPGRAGGRSHPDGNS